MIYTEDIDIAALGNVQSITRASHVEPTDGNQWAANMGPVGGPVLGAFDKRSDALTAEIHWIEQNILGGTKS
jgi:hypothetical protein